MLRYELVALSAFVLCVGAVLGSSELTDQIQADYVPPDRRAAQQITGATEPIIGDLLPSSIHTLLPHGRTAVILLSDCGECSFLAVDSLAKFRGISKFVLLAPDPDADYIAKISRAPLPVEVQTLGAQMKFQLNGHFSPRLYIYDVDRRLEYIQRAPQVWEKFVAETNATLDDN